MNTEPLERKLVAILYADVAGYSRLTGEDEEGTHRTLSAYLDAITVSIKKYHGTVMHFAGDAVLAEFAAVSDALACAIDSQHELKERNKALPENRQVQFRMGVNLGEVIVDRGEIYGDGVNVAARLESLAEPGGVCISESVHTAVGNKLALDYEDLGEQAVKNIDKPVRAYSARLKPGAARPAPRAKRRRPQRHAIVASAVALIIIAVGVIAWLALWAPGTALLSEPQTVSPLPDRPSIAVLPFTNLSNDPQQEYFSDGITNDLITELSKLSDLLVIASNSVFTYKGRAVKVQEVSQDLGVRYVLEGSVQKAGARLRINAQLIDAGSGHHLWAERFDRTLEDVFALQDEITQKIVTALSVKLTEEEHKRLAHRYTSSIEAYDYFLQALALVSLRTERENGRARTLYQRAIELDPTFARAYSGLALTYLEDFRQGWSMQPEESIEQALRLAKKAVALDDALPEAQLVLGQVYLSRKEHALAMEATRRSLALRPSYANAYVLLAAVHNYMGEPTDGLALMRKAMRLNPRATYVYFFVLGQAHYLLGEYDDALSALTVAYDRNQRYLPTRLLLAATYVRLDRLDDAGWLGDQVLADDPNFTLDRWMQTRPVADPAQLAGEVADLRKAGLP